MIAHEFYSHVVALFDGQDCGDESILGLGPCGVRRENVIRAEINRPRRTFWSIDDYTKPK